MSEHVPDLRGGSRETAKFVLGPVFAAAVVVGGLIWHAASMATKGEVQEVRREVQELREWKSGVTEQLRSIRGATERIERSLESRASDDDNKERRRRR